MREIIKTARGLDIACKVLQIALMIGFVCCCVAVGIITVGLAFNLPYNMIGTGFNEFDLGSISLTLAPEFAPKTQTVLWYLVCESALLAVIIFIVRSFVVSLRKVLASVKQGLPFDDSVFTHLKKMGLKMIFIGLGINLLKLTAWIFNSYVFKLGTVLINDKITDISFTGELELSFFIVAAIIYLLAYIFHYGASLQLQVDETL